MEEYPIKKTNKKLRVYENLVDLISDPDNPTPLLAVNGNINPKEDYQIYLKLERFNPCGSIKDRTALNLLEGTEIKNGKTIVEPSSGNTGIALASIANAMGIPLEIAIPYRRAVPHSVHAPVLPPYRGSQDAA